MRRRTWISLSAALLGLPLLLYLGLLLGLATPLLNLGLKRELGGLFNGEVRFGSFRSDLFSYAEIDDLLVLTRSGDAKLPVLTAGRIRLNYDGWQLLRGRVALEDAIEVLGIRGMRVFLLRDQKGRWNLREVLKLPEGGRRKKKLPGEAKPMIPLATRLVLEDSTVIFNDERRSFQSTVENLEGTLDARAFPLIAFSLSGRTEEQKKDNLSFAGEYNAEESSLFARADLDAVPLKTYLNYALPAGGLQFLGGNASLSVRVRQNAGDAEPDFAGRADVHDGSLAIPGISDPLSHFNGEVLFGDDSFRVNGVTAEFLGSSWLASGELKGLRSPTLNLVLENSSVALSPLSAQIHGLHALALSGTASLSVTMTGKAKDPVAEGELRAPQMQIAGIELADVTAGLRLTKAGLKVPSLKGRLWSGSVQGDAELAFPRPKLGIPGSITAKLRATGVDLSLLRYRGVEYLPLSGTANLNVSVEGPLLKPRVAAQFICPTAFFANRPMGRLELVATVQGKNLEISLATWRGMLDAKIGLNFDGPAEFVDSQVQMHHFPLDELMRGIGESQITALISPALKARMNLELKRYKGSADVELALSGPVKAPDLALKVIKHDGYLLNPPGLWHFKNPKGLEFHSAGLLRLGPEGLKFGDDKLPFVVNISGKDGGAEARLQGRLPLKLSQVKKGDGLDIKSSASLGVLDELDICKKTKGSAELDFRVQGGLDGLSVSGWAQIKDFSTEMQKYLSELKNGEAEIWVKDQQLTIENLSFESGGTFEASGRLDFSSGLKPYGSIEAHTDAESGLALSNFNYGDMNLVLQPLTLGFHGPDGMSIAGKASLHDSVITLPKPKGQALGPATGAPASEPYPLDFDLKAEINENVWLKKIQEGAEFKFDDPLAFLRDTLSSAQETLQSPAFEFLFKPTERDFLIQGPPSDLRLDGVIGIDRGNLIFMENEFKIRQETTENKVVFDRYHGRRGDVHAQAVAQLRYVRELPGGKVEPHSVRVTANIEPLTEEELKEAHLENSLLNYNLASFDSDPPFSDNPVLQRQAVLSLLVLGDPLNEGTRETVSSGPATDAGSGANVSQLISFQASRLLSGELRKFVNHYAKFLGGQVLDYVRLAPRVRYQGSSSQAVAQSSAVQEKELSQQVQQEGFRVSWLFELGRSLGKDLYTSATLLLMGDDDINAVKAQNTGPKPMDVRNYGIRLGTEYRFSPTRLAELSYGYSADENLDPVAYDPDNLATAHQVYLGIRNTLPTDSYSAALAHARHLEKLRSQEKTE